MLRVLYAATHPVQYLSPLLDSLQSSKYLDVVALYGNDAGTRSSYDKEFGRTTTWDIPMTEGHRHRFVSRGPRSIGSLKAAELGPVIRSVRGADLVVVNGYATPFTATVIAACLATRTPYLLRSDSTSITPRHRLDPRRLWAEFVSGRASGALSSGIRNTAVHSARGVRRMYPVPFTVDVTRFATAANDSASKRAELRSAVGLPRAGRLVIFAGKLQSHKRPGDLVAALDLLPAGIHLVFVGEGPLRAELEAAADPARTTFLGFVNQSMMPQTLAAADVLVLPSERDAWGLVVNEGLACGLVPVVSDQVGCAPDLVSGIGESYPVGDVPALAAAIDRALQRVGTEEHARHVTDFLQRYSVATAAHALERAVMDALAQTSS